MRTGSIALAKSTGVLLSVTFRGYALIIRIQVFFKRTTLLSKHVSIPLMSHQLINNFQSETLK